MSLIQDALRKAQEERSRGREPGPGDNDNSRYDDLRDNRYDDRYDNNDTREERGAPFFSGKRMLVYSLLFLVVVVSIVFVTVIFKPPTQSTMKVLSGGKETTPVTPDAGTIAGPKQEAVPMTGMPVAREPQASPVTMEKAEPTPVQVKKSDPSEVLKPKIEARAVPVSVKSVKPKKSAPAESECDRLTAEGDVLSGKREFVLAVDRYKKALAVEKRVSLYLKLYSSFKAMKNHVLARAYIDEGLRDFPDSFALNKVSAILYIRDRDFDRALKSIDTALGQNRGDYAVFTYKGLCHFHKRDYEKALLDFKASLDLNSDAVENYYYIGLIYDNVKDYPKALEFYRVFFKLNPETENFKHREWVVKRINELERYLR